MPTVGAGVVDGSATGPDDVPPLRIRLLGPLAVMRGDFPLALPNSRKARALLAYLALSPVAVPRSRLCDLFWEGASDPLGELRWCLSKIRSLLDRDGKSRVVTHADRVALDLRDCLVDVAEVGAAIHAGVDHLPLHRLEELEARFVGDFLDHLTLDGSPAFEAWLDAQRRRCRGQHVAILDRLSAQTGGETSIASLEHWMRLAPFDRRAHERFLAVLAESGRLPEAEAHLDFVARQFEAEGLDFAPLRARWPALKARAAGPGAFLAGPRIDDAAPMAPAVRRASLAVMPFLDLAAGRGDSRVAAALTHDTITRLAKLRSLFVIAQGTVFALHGRGIGADEAGRLLEVDYVAGGLVRRHGGRLAVTVEVAETRTARIVWTEVFEAARTGALDVLDALGDRIVSAVAREIEMSECRRAVLKPPNSLDAWEAHHRGLWHMYRFSPEDNAQARRFFELATRLDPTFSRAHAGLSFTYFQDAFQGWSARAEAAARAAAAAEQSLLADDHDPAAHWASGRASWLLGDHDPAVAALERSIDLSPNFALGHYTLAFVHAQAGDPRGAIAASDHSRELSPFDPLMFGMLGVRAIALARIGEFEQAADWGARAAARPNAHIHILAIAAYTEALAGAWSAARAHLEAIHALRPDYGVEDFLDAFRFDPDAASLFRRAAHRLEVR